jgi:pyruvate carboxylase subunit B
VELIAREGEREEHVRVRPLPGRDGDRFEVTVGERTYRVEAVRVHAGAGLWSLIVDGAQHEVAVAAEGDDGYCVTTGAGLHQVSVSDPLTHLARTAHGAATGGGTETVKAYMPGRVVALLVEEGAEVAAGQGVVVLEAMKMENEIAAEHAGTVGKIHVEEGQAVEGGDPLFELLELVNESPAVTRALPGAPRKTR